MQLRALLESWEAGIAAGPDDHIRPEFAQDLFDPAHGPSDIGRRLDIMANGRRRQAALEIGDLQRLQAETLPADQGLLHPADGTDKEDLAVRLPALQQLCHSDGRVNVPAGPRRM